MKVKLRRRRFGQLTFVGVLATVIGKFTKKTSAQITPQPSQTDTVTVNLKINGKKQTLQVEPRVTLLDALREYIGLTGTKKGCGHGQCGACTVLVNGRRINSCLTLAIMNEGAEITTIEGLAQGDDLHPVQAAFIKHDGFQCGYCTPGQICSAVAAITEVKQGRVSAVTPDVRKEGQIELTDTEIRERMSGNLCRCGAYPGIVAAVKEASSQVEG
ncbi:MAG: 2Fe-2S iron-sulfur cluster binding domain-containing protein [Rivularia sp. (in: Bacteria)]|nr:2Fe-2S iron-sulfur cluster binding domain-containing protein [Rivularia sp. MS3]